MPASLVIPSASVEYLTVDVLAASDPSSATVDFATSADGNEPTTGWVAGSWTGTATALTDGTYRRRARVLFGSTLNPGAGRWLVWVRVNSAPEAVIRQVAYVTVT